MYKYESEEIRHLWTEKLVDPLDGTEETDLGTTRLEADDRIWIRSSRELNVFLLFRAYSREIPDERTRRSGYVLGAFRSLRCVIT